MSETNEAPPPAAPTIHDWSDPAQLQALGEAVAARFPERVQQIVVARRELSLTVLPQDLLAVMAHLRDEPAFAFQQLMDVCGVDYPSRQPRFDVVYNLLSVTKNRRLRIKVPTDEATPVPSVTGLWPVAGWFEREAYDLFGIRFSGHADLRRILTDYGFDGHPLRKDFPLTGHVEMRFDQEQKRVIYEPVRLAQDFRRFDTESPWEGMVDVQLPGDEKAVRPKFGGAR